MKADGARFGRILRSTVTVAALLSLSPPLRALGAPCVMSPGTWCEIPATRMSEVFPRRDGHPAWGIVGPRAVTLAWGGGAFDSKRNRLIITGGGHADYGGNEVYEFDVASMKWKRATEPSRMREVRDREYVVEGGEAPVSSHTYGGLVYLPNVDRVFKFGGSYYRSGNAYDRHAYLYDVEAREWSRRAAAPRPALTPVADYDVKTRQVFVASANGLLSYDPTSDTWQMLPGDPHQAIYAGAIDEDTRRFVIISRPGEMLFYDLNKIGPRQRAPLKGKADWGIRVGIAYHPPSRQLVLWEGGREVWTVDARTRQVCKIENAAGTAPTATAIGGRAKTQGIYGRWRYVPSLDLFIGYSDSGDNVWLYKPALRSDGYRPNSEARSCE